MWLPCPYLRAQVELTDERRAHIERRHPELLPTHEERLIETVADPDRVLVDDDYAGTRCWFGGMVMLTVAST